MASRKIEWWQKYPIYQIYPRSFKDSNGDGTGDLKGIVDKLDYLEWLGVRAVWLSPIYKSPMVDFGYDVSDYKDIHPIFGNLEDFENLTSAMHEKGMYVIMDFVANHTSEEHPWFVASKKREQPYDKYYVWREGVTDEQSKERKPPNDVMSVFGGSAWTWCEERNQYYLHHFLKEQPNLNYDCPEVRREMKDVLKYWVDLGVDGFRVDAAPFIGNDESGKTDLQMKDLQKPEVVANVDSNARRPTGKTYDICKEWIEFLRDTYEKVDSHPRHIFMCTEGYADLSSVLHYYDVGVDFPFNFAFVNWTRKSTSDDLRRWIREWMQRMTEQDTKNAHKRRHRSAESAQQHRWPNWVAGNHDQPRIASRLGSQDYIDVANLLLLTLPGTPTCYYGDELGLMDVPVTFEQCQDPYGKRFGPDKYRDYTRDPTRTPMPWMAAVKHAGFTADTAKPWLPMIGDLPHFAVDTQRNDPCSHLNFFRNLMHFRQATPTLHAMGYNFALLAETEKNFLVFERPGEHKDYSYVVILQVNFGSQGNAESKNGAMHNGAETSTLDLSAAVDGEAKIVLKTPNVNDEIYEENQKIDVSKIELRKGEGLILLVEKAKTKRRKTEDGN